MKKIDNRIVLCIALQHISQETNKPFLS